MCFWIHDYPQSGNVAHVLTMVYIYIYMYFHNGVILWKWYYIYIMLYTYNDYIFTYDCGHEHFELFWDGESTSIGYGYFCQNLWCFCLLGGSACWGVMISHPHSIRMIWYKRMVNPTDQGQQHHQRARLRMSPSECCCIGRTCTFGNKTWQWRIP